MILRVERSNGKKLHENCPLVSVCFSCFSCVGCGCDFFSWSSLRSGDGGDVRRRRRGSGDDGNEGIWSGVSSDCETSLETESETFSSEI